MTQTPQRSSLINKRTVFGGLLLGIISVIGALLFTLFFITKMVHGKYISFLAAANLSHSQLVTLVKNIDPQTHDQPLTILVLGVDETENRPGFPQLTDTMMLLRVDPLESTISTLPLPRDLWSSEYQTKINALLEYGKERNPDDPTQFPKEVIQDLTGQTIDNTLVISLAQLGQIIDLFGCITIDVEEGFTDELFPRDDIDITTERDPAKLYETVVFETGPQSMNGQTALKYIRSRNSENENSGTDLARSIRQQQVISALIKKVSNIQLYWYYPSLAGSLLSFYQEEFAQYLPLEQALSLGANLGSSASNLTMNSYNLPVYPKEENGVIEHPSNLQPFQQQWVYVVRDQTEFKNIINDSLNHN